MNEEINYIKKKRNKQDMRFLTLFYVLVWMMIQNILFTILTYSHAPDLPSRMILNYFFLKDFKQRQNLI